MTFRSVLRLPIAFVLSIAIPGRAAGQPPAPALLSPASGAGVQEPFTISWSAVTDPNGIVAYNWQVSPSSTFSPVILQNSTTGQTTQDTVSGLANGTYFWRVQAVNGAFQQGPFSQARSVTVTGVGAGAPGTPTLGAPKGYSTFHPYEVMTFTWSAVPSAATYVFEASTDPSFPVCCSTIKFDNIPNTTMSFAIGNPEGNYSARVLAVNANGVFSAPSNLTTFSVFFNNPLPPPPSPLAPPNGATLTLPITIKWTDVPNPQPSGYDLQIAKDNKFQTIEDLDSQLNDPTRTVLSLTPGQKFWRVHSVQGSSSPTTAAVTAWSATGTFTVSSAPPTPVSVQFTTNPLTSGDTTWVQLQLTGAPPGPTNISLTSSNPSAAPVPATITMPANIAWTQFQMQAGQVASATPATITATLNGASASGQITVAPTALKSLSISPSTINGGAQPGGIVMLSGQAPPGGAAVTLSSSSPAVTPPPSVFVNPGDFSVSFPIQTSRVTANTTATVTASWNGTSTQAQVTLTPQPAPTSITLNPTSTVGTSGSSFATVTIASPQATDTILQVASSQPTIAQVPNSVMVPAGVTNGGFNIFTTQVTTQTLVTISVSGGGVTKSAVLTVNPDGTAPPAASLSSFTVSPTSVTGGNPSTGTVTLASPAPAGGTVVSLSSNQPGAASVPASVPVAAGATSATFTITTFPSAGTTVQLSAGVGNQFLFAALSVNPPPASAALSAVTVNPTSVVGGSASTGTVTLSAAAPNGGAVVSLASSNTAAATGPASVTVAAGATSATFTVSTSSVTASTSSTISGTFGGATRSVVLTVTPPPATASLSTLTLNPTSVTGGTASQGTVTLSSAAPAGGFAVSLSSSGAAATVPPSVTVAPGATSATFGITTSAVTASTPVTITATAGTVTRTATLTVNPPGQAATLTVTATGRSGELVTSSPAGLSVAVGSTGSASFATGTSMTLTASNGRDVIWSGACSSGGNKVKSCTFTLTANASVTANVQ